MPEQTRTLGSEIIGACRKPNCPFTDDEVEIAYSVVRWTIEQKKKERNRRPKGNRTKEKENNADSATSSPSASDNA